MAYEECPECGQRKHQLMACSFCGYQRRKAPQPEMTTAPAKKHAAKPKGTSQTKKNKRRVSSTKAADFAVCSECGAHVKKSNLSKHRRRCHSRKHPVPVRKDPGYFSNAREMREATKANARAMRRANDANTLCSDKQIAEFLKRNPLPDQMGKFGVPQDKYRYGFYGSKSMEYDSWRQEYKEKG
jgi:ribosomal protein L32